MNLGAVAGARGVGWLKTSTNLGFTDWRGESSVCERVLEDRESAKGALLVREGVWNGSMVLNCLSTC
jgi:hypothetical protein